MNAIAFGVPAEEYHQRELGVVSAGAAAPNPNSPAAACAASSYAAEQSPVDDEEMYEAYLFKYGLD